MKTITDANELQAELDGLSLVGHRILALDILGRLQYLDHQSMLDCYNNCIAPEGGPYRKPGDAILESEIPLDFRRTRLISTGGPYIMKLDDGRMLEMLVAGVSETAVSICSVKVYERNGKIDVGKIMAPIIGERISSVTVDRLPEGAYERYYTRGIPNPFKHIRIDCEENSLYLSFPTCTVVRNAKGLYPLSMTMGELKDAVSYYGDLFD